MSEYDRSFYEQLHLSSRSSAEEIVPFLLEKYHPKSIIDVGCGGGEFINEFKQSGVSAIGVEGDWVLPLYEKHPEWLIIANLSEKIEIKTVFDIALCLEVAEHIHESFSDTLIENLVSLSNRIVFSAAIPGQSGTGHINLRYPEYWAKKFAKHGFFLEYDPRSEFWSNEKVAPWYSQNLLVFANSSIFHLDFKLPRTLRHPEIFSISKTLKRTVLQILKCFKVYK